MHIVPGPGDTAPPDPTITDEVVAFRDAFGLFASAYPARVVFFGLLREWADRLPEFLDGTDDRRPGPDLWRRKRGGDRLDRNGVQSDGTLVMTFSIREYAVANMIGFGRACANRNAGNSKGYSGGKNFPERVASMNSVLGEIAAARFFGVRFTIEEALWPRSEHDENRVAPDLREIGVEVKAVRHKNSNPTIKHKDVKAGRILLVVAPNNDEFTQARIMGWGLVEELFYKHGKQPTWWDPKVNGKWNPEMGDRQVPLTVLHRCCVPVDGEHQCGLASAA